VKNEDLADLKKEAKAMRLHYTSDGTPGYSRKQKGKSLTFFDAQGKKITDKSELSRIKALALPPAWTNVWICADPIGHLQATGKDLLGRKQYKYHREWTLHRNEHKHNQMLDFARALPTIRKKLEGDLRQEGFSKNKVLALAISIMDKTFIRVGNSAYTKMYGSFGLTSLRNRHIKISGNKMLIAFRGKKGVFREIALTHSRLSKMMKKLKDIPGHELFQFYDTDGTKKTIDSNCINEYLNLCTGKDFTAKDFRTWWGTVTAASCLSEIRDIEGEGNPQKEIITTLDSVAKKLGNTRSVCKKYYVHPALLTSYQEGKLDKYFSKLDRLKRINGHEDSIMSPEEKIVMEFMEKECLQEL
jgi:DNA topoisomerase-1